MSDILVAPTPQELDKEPTVVLYREGWNNGSGWSPHGIAYMVRFNHGKATVLKSHYDGCLKPYADAIGIEVDVDPEVDLPAPAKKVTKKKATKTAVKKPAAKKKTAPNDNSA